MISSAPHVTIILASYNGARYISAQLQSLAQQSHCNWHVVLTDDGSSDDTVKIAQNSLPERCLTIVAGPQKGVTANFLSGLHGVHETDYVAFCDQDDVWHPNKLERAISQLSDVDGPAFYSSAREVTDQALRPLKTQIRRSATFSSLMFRNCAAGNTLVMNSDALDRLHTCWPQTCPAFHDWWSALVLTSAGATWIHDPEPTIFYRQHDGNFLGAYGGRTRAVLRGTYVRWISQNINALQSARPYMTDAHRMKFDTLQMWLMRAGLPIAPESVKTDMHLQPEKSRHVGWLRKFANGNGHSP